MGASPIVSTPSIPARRLGPYEIVGQLGAGGMGEVWLARDTRLEREVALKVLPARLTSSPEALAGFRNEALALASLNHPNIATIHGLEEMPGGAVVLVLERVEGESLAQRLARSPFAVDEALQVSAQVAMALEVAHERGVVHRDLKPGNVMIGPRGLVKVLDFGLAKRTYGLTQAGDGSHVQQPPVFAASSEQPATLSGPIAGTPGYMSPEQVLAGMQDERTDVFAFGCLLYECLSGRRAFASDDPYVAMAQVLNDTPDAAALPERTPPAVRTLLDACLAKDPEVRPRVMRELRYQLEEALGIRRATALREGGAAATPHNLPAPVSSFVGRADTLATCARMLGETRLLTLTGIGGSGKTRIALKLAEDALDTFRDGVWFVDVAPLTEPGRLVEALAAVLEVRDEPGPRARGRRRREARVAAVAGDPRQRRDAKRGERRPRHPPAPGLHGDQGARHPPRVARHRGRGHVHRAHALGAHGGDAKRRRGGHERGRAPVLRARARGAARVRADRRERRRGGGDLPPAGRHPARARAGRHARQAARRRADPRPARRPLQAARALGDRRAVAPADRARR
jgi:hypothetical protein